MLVKSRVIRMTETRVCQIVMPVLVLVRGGASLILLLLVLTAIVIAGFFASRLFVFTRSPD